MTREVRAVILAGIAGAGKSTVGALLAEKLGWPFLDTNTLHPPSNIEKMRRGIALEDDDRWPWLKRVRRQIDKMLAEGGTGVFECSALKEIYRDYLLAGNPDAWVVLLAVDRELARARVATRLGHYFPVTLVDSQFATLEDIRCGIAVDGSRSPETIVNKIRKLLGLCARRGVENNKLAKSSPCHCFHTLGKSRQSSRS